MTATSAHISAKEERKLRKPLIERKRRERINHCLDQLKETVVGAFRLDQSKLEKADILEMTVKHLQNIQSNGFSDCIPDPEAQQRYSTGYIQCMQEVHNLLLSCDWMDKTLASRLLKHLLRSLPQMASNDPKFPNVSLANVSPTHSDGAYFHTDEPESPKHCSPSPVLCESATRFPVRTTHDAESARLAVLDMWRPW